MAGQREYLKLPFSRYLRKINLMSSLVMMTPLTVLALVAFRYSPQLQFQVLTMAALAYLSLALLHHNKDKTLTWEIIIEYALIAALTLIILGGLII